MEPLSPGFSSRLFAVLAVLEEILELLSRFLGKLVDAVVE